MKYRLGELSKIYTGRLDANAASADGVYPFFTCSAEPLRINEWRYDCECVLVAGNCNPYVSYYKGKFNAYQRVYIIEPQNGDLLDVKYLYYYLKLYMAKSIDRQHGAIEKFFHLSDFTEIILDLPNIEEQRQISNALYSLDRKIALNRRKIATLEKMAKEIYDYWFVQYDFPDANGHPYKSSGGEMVYSPELKREIPRGWKVTKIADVLAKIPSTERVQTANYADSGAIPIIDQSEKFIAGYTENNAAALALNSCVVFGDHSCTVKYVNFSFARGADGTQILHSNTPMVDDTQLYFNLLGIDFDEGYKRHFSALKDKLIVISPDASLTATYTSVVDGLFAQIRVLRQKTNTISALRDFLLPLLMNGQVKVGELYGAD